MNVQALGCLKLRSCPRADPFAIQGLAARWLRAFALPPPLSLSLRIGPTLRLACTAHCEVLPQFSSLQACAACPCHDAVLPSTPEPQHGVCGCVLDR